MSGIMYPGFCGPCGYRRNLYARPTILSIMPTEIKRTHRQSGSTKSPAKDRARTAMYPGKRKSAAGKTYWETRKNRSDISKKKRI